MTASAWGFVSLKPIVCFPFHSPHPAKIFSPTRKCGSPHVRVSLVSGSARQIARIFARTGSALGMPEANRSDRPIEPSMIASHDRVEPDPRAELRLLRDPRRLGKGH